MRKGANPWEPKDIVDYLLGNDINHFNSSPSARHEKITCYHGYYANKIISDYTPQAVTNPGPANLVDKAFIPLLLIKPCQPTQFLVNIPHPHWHSQI